MWAGVSFPCKTKAELLGNLADAVGCPFEDIWETDHGLLTLGYWRLQRLGVRLWCWQ